MSPAQPPQGVNEKLVQAYSRMLERIKTATQQAGHDTLSTLQQHIENAKHKAVELGELTREEADKIAAYLKRDLHDAAQHLKETGKELGDWLRFDLELIEERLGEMFSLLVDRTRVELDRLALYAKQPGDQKTEQWRTGEVTGVGTLRCTTCGQLMHFHAIGHIPPCPTCHGTEFRRARATD